MSGKIITSTRKLDRRPGLAALLSLAAPGLGQAYAGFPARGAAFALAAALPLLALPFYVLTTEKQEIRIEYLAAWAAFALAWAGSGAHAYLLAKKKGAIVARWFNSIVLYVAWALAVWALVAASMAVMAASFQVARVTQDCACALAPKGSVILVNPLAHKNYSPGDMVMTADSGLYRVMALHPDRVNARQGVLVINGLALDHRAPSDGEAAGLAPGSPEDLYYEKNRGAEYPVEQRMPRVFTEGPKSIPLKRGELLLAKDNRMNAGWFRAVSNGEIMGRAQVLFRCPAIKFIDTISKNH